MSLTAAQIIFIIVVPIVVIVCLLIFVVFPLIKRHNNIKFKEYYYKKIYAISNSKDYLLINNFSFAFDEKYKYKIDHMLFGDKYIYLILDYRFDGHLTGDQHDSNIIVNKDNGEKLYHINPLIDVKTLVESFSSYSALNEDLFIGVALINNECNVAIKNTSSKYYIIQRNRLEKLLEAIESRDIPNLDEDSIQDFVVRLHKLKQK